MLKDAYQQMAFWQRGVHFPQMSSHLFSSYEKSREESQDTKWRKKQKGILAIQQETFKSGHSRMPWTQNDDSEMWSAFSVRNGTQKWCLCASCPVWGGQVIDSSGWGADLGEFAGFGHIRGRSLGTLWYLLIRSNIWIQSEDTLQINLRQKHSRDLSQYY